MAQVKIYPPPTKKKNNNAEKEICAWKQYIVHCQIQCRFHLNGHTSVTFPQTQKL